jgi:hypothetical protein
LLDTRTAGNESGSAGCAALRVTQFSVGFSTRSTMPKRGLFCLEWSK